MIFNPSHRSISSLLSILVTFLFPPTNNNFVNLDGCRIIADTSSIVEGYPTSTTPRPPNRRGTTTTMSRDYTFRRPRQRQQEQQSSSSPFIIGYAHNVKSGKAEQAIRDGASVIIWSFVHLDLEIVAENNQIDDTQHQQQQEQEKMKMARIRTELDLKEIRTLRAKYKNVVHLAAFGGWNGPHPPSSSSWSLTGSQWFEVFAKFNEENGYLFDGIDWDYEGHDDLNAPTAKFTIETLDIMADFSIDAKQHGMIVSMAPAESYLDSSIPPGKKSIDGEFSLQLDLPPRAWTSDRYHATDEDRELVTSRGFRHAGRQCYAYVLAKAGIETFDWVSIQFYEAYSPFAHDVHRRKSKLEVSEALLVRIRNLIDGYTVTNLPLGVDDGEGVVSDYEVKIPPDKLVVGIANGWADGLKFCKVDPPSIRKAYETTLAEYGEGFLGVMFWTIEEEGEEENLRLTHMLKREFQSVGMPFSDEL